ncbi:MAG: STAS-like domain-containing protein [Muribaculaceae bacterium]|nr:STAS-like domain-containing protein [Muribaculaceae bacterium]
MKTVFLKFNKFGTNLGTRQLGAQAREELVSLLNTSNKVVLDFEGVNVVSNSFADECLGKLLLSMSLDDIKAATTFHGLNDFARHNIAVALRRRLKSLSSQTRHDSSSFQWQH